MNNFSINPNFNIENFNNIVNDFNKEFTSQIQDANNFEEIFNSFNTQNPNQTNEINNVLNPISETNNINTNVSPVAKLALDIQNGFSNSLNDLNAVQRQAENDFETFASGGDISVHEVMISAQKSNLAMQMAIQLRNQVLNAYNEFKNMGI